MLTDDVGRIVAVGADRDVPDPDGAQRVEYSDAVVLPGLINAHTHLELHAFRDDVPERDFAAWIAHMRRIREDASPEAYVAGVRAGLRETWRFGTTAVGDTGMSGATVRVMGEMGGRGIYYHELIDPDPTSATATLRRVAGEVERLVREAPPSVRVGISPHAPYTVSADLAAGAAEWARRDDLPVATHLAESNAEQRFLTEAAGPFADRWRERGLPPPTKFRSAVAWADAHGLLRPGFVAVHAVHSDADDVALLAERGAAVAVCPRSNAGHGHGTPPLAAMLDAGLTVGLGTDSAVSVGELDLLAEARAARALAGLSAERALRLATLDAARVLGLDRWIGSLEAGKWADLCVVRCGGEPLADGAVPGRLLDAGGCSIISTYVAGRRVYGTDS